MSVKKIVFAGSFSFPEGIAASSRIRNLVIGMVKNGIEVDVVSMYQKQTREWEPLASSPVRYEAVLPLRREPGLFNKIRSKVLFYANTLVLVGKIVEKLNGSADEVIFIYGRNFVFIKTLLHRLAKLGYETKTIFDVVEPHRSRITKWEYFRHPFVWDSALVFKLLLNKFTMCTYITHALAERYPNSKGISYILPGVVCQRGYDPLVGDNVDSEIKVAYIGALLDKDHPELLVRFCEAVNNTGVPWRLKVIGRYELSLEGRLVRRRLEDLLPSEVVTFHNDPQDEELDKLMTDVSFVTLFRKPAPLQHYTFPTRAVEVMEQGKMIITNDFGEFASYVSDDDCAVIIQDKDLAVEVSTWVQDTSAGKYIRGSQAARRLVARQFDPVKHCKAMLRALDQL